MKHFYTIYRMSFSHKYRIGLNKLLFKYRPVFRMSVYYTQTEQSSLVSRKKLGDVNHRLFAVPPDA
jgi:hypothetical protein